MKISIAIDMKGEKKKIVSSALKLLHYFVLPLHLVFTHFFWYVLQFHYCQIQIEAHRRLPSGGPPHSPFTSLLPSKKGPSFLFPSYAKHLPSTYLKLPHVKFVTSSLSIYILFRQY